MDRVPLLALIRRHAGLPTDPSVENTAAENMRQLTHLRWIAVAGQTVAILLVHFGLEFPLPLFEMLAVVLALAAANLLAIIAFRGRRVQNHQVMFALLLDMGALTLQLYFSGGATNPFISLYLLQVVLGAILLPPGQVAMLLAAAASAYAFLSMRYVPLALSGRFTAERADLFAVGQWIGFVMVAGLLVLFIVRISRNLSARDAYVADLRQRAAEEDGIVRMGLFASGAAHELGTPLGTLSVILADWMRMPAIADDPELRIDVEEMQAEVRRCKAIVTDILHSAGQPRGEAMERTTAGVFLDNIVEAWRQTRQVALEYRREGAARAIIALDPALRQAIWNLLDNAAEASPWGVRLTADVEEAMLTIAVRDWGDGFPPEVLVNLGSLFQSTKGIGHGLGLFLTNNVARRLGGRLEARNLADSGAEVRLLLPLVIAQEEG